MKDIQKYQELLFHPNILDMSLVVLNNCNLRMNMLMGTYNWNILNLNMLKRDKYNLDTYRLDLYR